MTIVNCEICDTPYLFVGHGPFGDICRTCEIWMIGHADDRTCDGMGIDNSSHHDEIHIDF